VARKSLRNVKVPQAIHAVLRMYHSVRAWDSQLSRTTGFVGTGPCQFPYCHLRIRDEALRLHNSLEDGQNPSDECSGMT